MTWSRADCPLAANQIMRIMRDSRNGSYATMGGCLWMIAKSAAISHLGVRCGASGWYVETSTGDRLLSATVAAQGPTAASR